MKLFELLRQIQDACQNDGNLNKEVIIYNKQEHESYNSVAISIEHPNSITLFVEWPNSI